MATGLTEMQKRELLTVARRSLQKHCGIEGRPLSPVVIAGRFYGAFVSLHTRDARELRGCIGRLGANTEIVPLVEDLAVSAGTRDSRFESVQRSELDALEIEISVLTAPRRVTGVKDIRVGVHGIRIRRGDAQGVLLPQVATEHGWNAESFLAHTCRKAGLEETAWRAPETIVEVFSAVVFREPRPVAD